MCLSTPACSQHSMDYWSVVWTALEHVKSARAHDFSLSHHKELYFIILDREEDYLPCCSVFKVFILLPFQMC